MGMTELGILLTIIFGILGVVGVNKLIIHKKENEVHVTDSKNAIVVTGNGKVNIINKSPEEQANEKMIMDSQEYCKETKRCEGVAVAGYKKTYNADRAIKEQSNLFHIAGRTVRFIPIICSWNRSEDEYYYGDVVVHISLNEYELPEDIGQSFYRCSIEDAEEKIIGNVYETKVRIDDYSADILGGNHPHRLYFRFSKATYRDFLIVRKMMDKEVMEGLTVRDKYFNHRQSLITRDLPNVCGVGIFVITADNKILLSKSSKNVVVNPERFIYTASGSMDWHGQYTNPFDDIIRECEEEIAYRPNIENLILYSFGIDYESGYYQFSFYERSDRTAEEIRSGAAMGRDFNIELQRIEAVDFNYKSVWNFIESHEWDETSKANLITLIVKRDGKKDVEQYIDPNREKEDYRKKVAAEWERRAKREGRLAVLSNRYSAIHIDEISEDYCEHVIKFIDEDLSDKSVIEVGGGIGLFTKYFAENARKVTCVDVSQGMIKRNKEFLGSALANKVNYIHCFFQDYDGTEHYDLLICSLVLIHNADELQEIVTNMKRMADTIYLFEHVEDGAQVSRFTEPKTKNEYVNLFPEYDVEKTESYLLSLDEIAFIKLVRRV